METTQPSDLRPTSSWRLWAQRLLEYLTYLFVLAVAVSVVSEWLLPAALLVGVGYMVTHLLAYGRLVPKTLADGGVLVLALMALLSLAISAFPELTRPQVNRLLVGMVLYYALVRWADHPQRLGLVYLGFVATGLLLALGALISVDWSNHKLFFLPADLTSRLPQLTSDSINPNVMAGYLALLLPLTAGPLLFAWSSLGRGLRTGLMLALIVMLTILLLTQSRAGIMAAAVALLVLLALRWRWCTLGLGLLAGAGLLSVGFGKHYVVLDFLGANVSLGGFATRQELWWRAWWMIQDFSFTGIGMGGFAQVTELLYPLFLSPTSQPHAHNLLLQVAVDLGVPGLVAYLATLGAVVLMAWRARQALTAEPYLRGFASGLLAAQVALLTHGIFDAVTWGMVRPAVMVWALWGAAAALWLVAEGGVRGGLALPENSSHHLEHLEGCKMLSEKSMN
ncbi:O-antigen ligase family protein [Candidatus Viridilinea mediisalina]|uniref:O-antigen ligase-related domain-containing protein n=1 Tax=Candidatus Viridilinea mediisalina TaxID=2024553 RepID=A0A2A6RKJ2_9CHLR|nr:O-antigen ligase family protein [Candidatus Viridilinea mediisalina]PDW03597.1 hypothetical protein CJ255_07975 [Candidatus Viridilinea mediisalina]